MVIRTSLGPINSKDGGGVGGWKLKIKLKRLELGLSLATTFTDTSKHEMIK